MKLRAAGISRSLDFDKVPYLSLGVPPSRCPPGCGCTTAGFTVFSAESLRLASGLELSSLSRSSPRFRYPPIRFDAVFELSAAGGSTDVSASPGLSTPPNSSTCTLLIRLATSHPSSVSAYFRSGLPFSCTRSLFTMVVIEFQAV